jgi:hypothetical protein
MEVVYLVLARSEPLENANIFASTPDRVDRNIELQLAHEEHRQLREGQVARGESGFDSTGHALNLLLDGFGDERRILGNVLEGPARQILG